MTSVFFRDHPEFVGIARDRDGGCRRLLRRRLARATRRRPPRPTSCSDRGSGMRVDVLQTDSAVLAREAVDLTGELGEITALLGAGGVLGSGVVNPRYVFLPISPTVPAARAFSEALGARHVSALDVNAYGMELDCHIVDFGTSGLLGFQRDWIYKETGMVPPVDSNEIDPGRLIRLLRDPNGLSHGPEWLGVTPSDRLDNLRRRVRESLTVFGDHRDDEVARAIIEEAFLGDGASHETIARRSI